MALRLFCACWRAWLLRVGGELFVFAEVRAQNAGQRDRLLACLRVDRVRLLAALPLDQLGSSEGVGECVAGWG